MDNRSTPSIILSELNLLWKKVNQLEAAQERICFLIDRIHADIGKMLPMLENDGK